TRCVPRTWSSPTATIVPIGWRRYSGPKGPTASFASVTCDLTIFVTAGDDQEVVWHKPQRPEWMDKATYATMPKSLTLRKVRTQIREPGFRVRELVVVTTLTDVQGYPKDAILDLFHDRWHVELDIRAIKQSLQMEVLRCQTPAMLHKEIWAHLLAYNLVR